MSSAWGSGYDDSEGEDSLGDSLEEEDEEDSSDSKDCGDGGARGGGGDKGDDGNACGKAPLA